MELLVGTFASKPLLIVRVFLGIIFFAHGSQKVFGWFGGPGLRWAIAYFKQGLGVPPPPTVRGGAPGVSRRGGDDRRPARAARRGRADYCDAGRHRDRALETRLLRQLGARARQG